MDTYVCYYYVCYYIDRYGREKQELFKTLEEGLAFCEELDKRIARGTCGGYDFTTIGR